MASPLQSEGQRLGAEAQNAFAMHVARSGDIWDPTAANADFGIDGRVALVKDGSVTGIEFAVQIKGTAKVTLNRDGSVLIGRVKTSTVRYWFSRLTPTLLVLYDASKEEFHLGWAHYVKDIFKRVAKFDHKEITLRIKSVRMDSDSWRTIVKQSEIMHEMVARSAPSINGTQRSTMGLLYLQTSGVADVLTELASLIAYNAGFALLPDGRVERRGSASGDILGHEHAGPHGNEGADIWSAFNLVSMLTDLLDSFVRSRPDGTEEIPAMLLLVEIVKQLLAHSPPVVSVIDGSNINQFHWVTVDGATIIAQLLTVLMHLRDFNRQVRTLLFPGSVEMESALLHAGEESSFRRFRSLREGSITPAADLARRWENHE